MQALQSSLRKVNHFVICTIVALLLSFIAVVCDGQVTTATFYGVVTDPSGAVIQKATVTLSRAATGYSIAKTTDTAGQFGFDFVPPGTYTLEIQAAGFKLYRATDIELGAAQQFRRTFALELGAVSQTVEVSGAAPLVNTISADQRESVSRREVVELPLSRRNFSNVLTVGTGVVSAGSGGLRLNGLGPGSAQVTVDGADAASNPENPSVSMYQNFNYIDTMSIEAIEDVQVTKGVIPAEYAYTLGGSINLTTRSGTNQYHGSLFENFQAENLNARNQFLASKVPLTFNQFGGSVGGPVVKNKVFFFGAYEGYRERAFTRITGNYPTQEFINKLLIAQPLFKTWAENMPRPTLPYSAGAETGVYEGTGSSAARDNHVVAKGDLDVGTLGRIGLTYTRGRPYRITPRAMAVNSREFIGTQERGAATYTVAGAAWTNETRFGYNYAGVDRVDNWYNVGLLPGVTEEFEGARRFPTFSVPGFSRDDSEMMQLFGPVWTIENKYARYIGSHTVKFGGIYSRRSNGRYNIEAPIITYSTTADLLAGIPSTVQNTLGVNPNKGRYYQWGLFIQDDWRLRSNLVVNMGIRYDYFSNFVAKPLSPKAPAALFNLNGGLDPSFTFGNLRDTNNPFDPDKWVNLGPRLGFSYNPDGQGKTVFRAGASAMFAPTPDDAYNNAVSAATNLPFRVIFSKQEALNLKLPFPYYNAYAVEALKNRGGNVMYFADLFSPKLKAPYTVNSYFGIQKTLTSTLVLETAYVGTRGVSFRMYRMPNLPDRVTGIRPNPNLQTRAYIDNSESTHYHSLQTSLRQRYSRNLTASAHYTWGKALSYAGGDTGADFNGDSDLNSVQEFFLISNNRGPSSGDNTHRFVADAVYDLPTLARVGNSIVRAAGGGWRISGVFTAVTGDPMQIGQTSSRTGSRPDYIGGDPILADYRETLQYLNRAAFTRVSLVTASGATARGGNLGNRALRGPGSVALNLSIGKNFRFAEKFQLQVRADAFNGLNHTNYSNPNTSINSSTFGTIRGTRGARTAQLNARLAW